MEAIREIQKVKNGQVLINLPDHFENSEVEIIILPLKMGESRLKLSELLLQGPTWTGEEIVEFEKNISEGYKN